MSSLDPDTVLVTVEAHLVSVLGQDTGRATVSFVGADRVDVLRFGPDPDGLVRYCTLGMSRSPMGDPSSFEVAEDGPRAELVLSVKGVQDSVLRRLGVLACSPAVEGVVVAPGASIELGEPLWDGARFTAVLVGEPGGLVPDIEVVEGSEPVRFLPVLPLTANEAAWKRVRGATALQQLFLEQGVDLRDPERAEVRLAA